MRERYEKKTDAEGTRGDIDASQGVSTTPREGTKVWGRNDHPSFYEQQNSQRTYGQRTLHSVRLDNSRRTAIGQQTQVEEHYILFILVTSKIKQTNRTFSN